MHVKNGFIGAAFAGLTMVVAHVTAQGPQTAPPAAGAPQSPAPQRGRGATIQGGGGRGGATFPAQQRPPGDPEVIARGRTLYGINCSGCHGPDLRGGDMGGPNLLRSHVVLDDQRGELIRPIIYGSRQSAGMDPVNIPEADVAAVAEFIHSVAAAGGSQGRPPAGPPVELNVLVGNATAGHAYFAATCGACHSVAGDLKGIATRIPDPKALQNFWVSGGAGGGRGGGGEGGGGGAPASRGLPVTVTVTLLSGQKVEGVLSRIDEFDVTLIQPDGTPRTLRRNGEVPRVEIHDPREAHRKLLPVYTDKDIHDVTAYLVTIK